MTSIYGKNISAEVRRIHAERFCIFTAISLPRAFTLEAMEKGLRHFSFSDVFRAFRNLGACLPFRKLFSFKFRHLCLCFEARCINYANN